MRKILIIDDEFTYVNDLAKGLKLFGYEVYKAGDGEGGISVLERIKPDVVFCDYKLPDVDGDYVLKRVKEFNPEIRFVMVTAYYEQGLKERLEQLGVDRVVYKPIAFGELEQLLSKFFQEKES